MGSTHRVNMGNNWRGQKEGVTQGGSRYKLKPTELKDQKLRDSKDEDFGFYRITKDSVGPKVWWHELDLSEYSSSSEEEEDDASIYKIDIMNKTSNPQNNMMMDTMNTTSNHLKNVMVNNMNNMNKTTNPDNNMMMNNMSKMNKHLKEVHMGTWTSRLYD